MTVLTAIEAADYLRLDQRYEALEDRRAALYRLVRRCGLRPVLGLKPYVFAAFELERFVRDQTEAFVREVEE